VDYGYCGAYFGWREYVYDFSKCGVGLLLLTVCGLRSTVYCSW
jgi:hypothetical protein